MYRKTLVLCFSGDYLNVPKIMESAKHLRVKENEILYMYIIHLSILLIFLWSVWKSCDKIRFFMETL